MEYSTKSPIKAAILAAILLLLLTACGKIQLDYEQTVEPCSVMEFRVSNVRETPAALTGELDNALGVIKEDSFTMLIASGEVFKATDPMVPANGVFYGIKVDDIVATPEGKAWFPDEKRLRSDSDGIVWVNWENATILVSSLD